MSEPKKYKSHSKKSSSSKVNEGAAAYRPEPKSLASMSSQLSDGMMDEVDLLTLLKASRKGVSYNYFHKLMGRCPFTLDEWSTYLHLSSRSMLRYRNDKKSFDPIQSEKILQIALIYDEGVKVFGSAEYFDEWLGSKVISLGGLVPKSLLDNNFGITLLRDQLGRIAHGVLA